MDKLCIKKIDRVDGIVTMPGSKSLSNRALLLSALGNGTTRLYNVLRSDDSKAMLDALKALGIKYEDNISYIDIYGNNGAFKVDGTIDLNLQNAGTAMRPLCAALALSSGTFTLTGIKRMCQRPIGDLIDALRALGLNIEYLNEVGFPPLKIVGSKVKEHEVSVSGNTSSQFLSALLMISPLCNGLKINVQGDLISKPYVDLTINLLKNFGVNIKRDDYRSFVIEPCNIISPKSFIVEGDATSASYFIAAGAIAGDLIIKGLSKNSTQGDIRFIDVLKSMGADISFEGDDIHVKKSTLHGIDIDMNDMPDAAMTLVPLALFTSSPIRIRNIASWRVKETDRIAAMVKEMSKLGVLVNAGHDYIYIDGSVKNNLPVVFDTYNDHRMAMSLSLIALDRDIVINDPKCTDKTFPTYFDLFKSIAK